MVAEGHSVWASGGGGVWVNLKEIGGKQIEVNISTCRSPLLTPDQARILAGWLCYFADHLEGKLDA